MKRRDPMDEIWIRGELYSIKRIQKLTTKDVAMSPKTPDDGYLGVWICPKCNEFHQMDYVVRDRYCSKCGQKIKWPRRRRKDVQ